MLGHLLYVCEEKITLKLGLLSPCPIKAVEYKKGHRRLFLKYHFMARGVDPGFLLLHNPSSPTALPQSDVLALKPSLCDPVKAFLRSTHHARDVCSQRWAVFISAGREMRPEATEVEPNHLQTYQKVQLFSALLTAQRVQKFTNSFSSRGGDAGYRNSVKKPEK